MVSLWEKCNSVHIFVQFCYLGTAKKSHFNISIKINFSFAFFHANVAKNIKMYLMSHDIKREWQREAFTLHF